MKSNKNLFWGLPLMIVMVISGVGCKKFLDKKPLTSTSDDLNQGALENNILGMYSTLRTYSGFSELVWLDFNSIRDDDAEKGSNQTDGSEINTSYETFQYAKSGWAPDTYWNDHYTMINLANTALDGSDAYKDPASLRNIGEACFLRAYAYFELVKAYGEVPLINYKVVTPADGIRQKSSVARIYEFIDSNLQVASTNLPVSDAEYGTGYDGRLTKGAANTLWAQTYLFRANWGKVVSLCNEVIGSGQYSLTPKFIDIWKDGTGGVGKNGPESIWETQNFCGQGAATNSAVDFGNQWGTCQQVRQGGAPIEWNLGWGWNTPTQNLVSAWSDTDPRKAATILFSGQSDGGPATGGYGATLPPYNADEAGGGIARKYWNKKVYSDPAMRQFTGFINNSGAARWINHRILRYADVLLMLAEAANETNDGATADAMLEKIRDRASGNLGPTRTILPHIAYVNQAQMRTAIKAERRFEFAMEGYRFYDLVRWNDAITVLGGLGYTNRARYYPIPQQALDQSGGVLTQNPEW
jgi:starch-binding outer membrane protein, SusD/RagB family